jgi:hypothetical protein
LLIQSDIHHFHFVILSIIELIVLKLCFIIICLFFQLVAGFLATGASAWLGSAVA